MMPTGLLLNLLLHGAAILLPLLLGAALLRDHGRRIESRLGALLALGASAFALASTPTFQSPLTLWHAPVMALSVANPFVFWLFSRSLLDDDFVLRPWHAAPWLALAAIGALPCVVVPTSELLGVPLRVWFAAPAIGLALLSGAQAFVSWREDLVESRRRVRVIIITAVAGYLLVVHAFILSKPGFGLLGLWGNTAMAAGILALSLFLMWRMALLRPDLYADARPSPVPEPAEAEPPAAPRTDMPDPRFLDLLMELMTVEQIYREENLTIGALALRMKLPEPKLRLLINQKLGHRNFNAFLNTYRIEDAKRALADPNFAEVPILTISMDAGFQSLGPFNRAFKAATGMTPSDFRREAAGAPVAPLAPMPVSPPFDPARASSIH